MEKNYYIGLDMGTNSVGWAVTTEGYELQEFKRKAMWGVRLFDEAKTAAERRFFRSSRRRLARKKWRLGLLQELFEEEINKVDNTFFMRMKDSSLWKEDKDDVLSTDYCLFSDKDYTDVDYHKEFPTIYHLRMKLMQNEKDYDVRLVYLALHNILKHRGHFLFEGKNMGAITSFESVFMDFINYLEDDLDIHIEYTSIEEFENILKDKKLTKTRKKENLSGLCFLTRENKREKAIIGLLSGTTEDLSVIYNDEGLKDLEKSKITFDSSTYEEERINLESILQERCYLLDRIKALYDWSILAEILDGGELDGKQYLSVSKVNVYEKHKKDLCILKRAVKNRFAEKYDEIFNSADEKSNYCSYVGHCLKNGKKIYVKRCKKEDFDKYIGAILKKMDEDDDVAYLMAEKEAGTLLPLQITGDNGVIPYQVHKTELIRILDNASTYLEFFNKKDDTNLSIKEKIIKIFEFRIPYYVGPLNAAHAEQGANCWIKRNEEGKILPWNFQQKVDIDASAEAFISRMTNKCTYLYGEDVLPKNSLLYSEFMVLNELNNVKINNEKINVDLKQKIYWNLFKMQKKVTGNKLVNYLKSEGYELDKEDLSGFDNDFSTSLGIYHDFKKILGERIEKDSVRNMVEQIIFWLTVYSDGGKILSRKVKQAYANELTSEEIDKICRLKCSGWGNLSRKFLQGIQGADKETGEIKSIIQALRQTNDNLMQLLSTRYSFEEAIADENSKNSIDFTNVSYENLVEDLYVSPAVKRAIWQTIQLTQEIKKCMKTDPKKIFIEMARGPEEKKERTISRKNQLLELYASIKNEMSSERDWIALIDSLEENQFRRQDIFLYFTQMGRDMYTGKAIDLNSILESSHYYDRDHIYPQSKTKDDSIINNLVLVNKNDNKRKGDGIVPSDIQNNMISFWKQLRDSKLISEEKYKRLTRKSPLTDEELAGFICRQIVETRQSTKAAATVLKEIFPETEVIYVKAGAVSDFKRDEVEMVKVREINDYHHAKDAYLNIIVGNVYNAKFTSNPVRWLAENKGCPYSLNQMFKRDFEKNGKIIWKMGQGGSLEKVRKIVNRNDILFTRYAYCNTGGLFDQQPVKAQKNKFPLKSQKLDTEKYGGYNSAKSAYFSLVESTKGNKKIRTIEVVPLYIVKKYEEDEAFAREFLESKYGLENPRIILKKIKKNSKLIINGFPMHLVSSTGSQLTEYVAAQLVLNCETEKYLKKITKYNERNAKRKDKKTNLLIGEKEGITRKENLAVYDVLLGKLKNTIYAKRPANPLKTLEQGREKFSNLSLEEECLTIGEILHIFQCKSATANLTLLDGVALAGSMKTNKDVSKFDSVKLVYQSVTGLYEQEIDLQKL